MRTEPTRSQVIEAVNLFRAKVIDVSNESLTIEATGTEEKVGSPDAGARAYGIHGSGRCSPGVVALSRDRAASTNPK